MKINRITIALLLLSYSKMMGQDLYEIAFLNLKKEHISFKEAVFIVENTFKENTLKMNAFQEQLNHLTALATKRFVADRLLYDKKDKVLIAQYAALFKVMTDTSDFFDRNGGFVRNLPFRYDFEDFLGETNWENMFVTKLLKTRKGNCHSLPYLYKILCEELGVPCYLALAPNHIYIKLRSEQAGWYNTELTNASFPIDAWLMASGYITLEAVQKGVYMDALDDKPCIALCVLDLAKGFDRKYPNNDGRFILQCCDWALEHFPKCINALLFKAETHKKQVERLMKMLHTDNLAILRLHQQGKIEWEAMNHLYTQIHHLGYRTMPEQMYVDWLISFQKEKEAYSNKQVMDLNKK